MTDEPIVLDDTSAPGDDDEGPVATELPDDVKNDEIVESDEDAEAG